jgi:effector-binding domain-containing protein
VYRIFVGNQKDMLIRVHPPMTVLYVTRQTTLKKSRELTASALRELYQYVADLDLLICGPQYRFIYGMDGRPDSPVTMEIALPVQGQIPTTLLPLFKQVLPFNCLCARFEGAWEGLSAEYSEMLDYIAYNDLEMTELYVETLLHIDFAAPACQLTEIQIGLCPSARAPKPGRVRAQVQMC